MDVLTAGIFTIISVVATLYAIQVHGWMRARVRAARGVGNGRLALACGLAATTARLLAVAVLCVLIGALVTVRDALEVAEQGFKGFGFGAGLRVLFILMILGIADSLRIEKRTYIGSERPR